MRAAEVTTINPTPDDVFATYPTTSEAELDRILDVGCEAQPDSAQRGLDEGQSAGCGRVRAEVSVERLAELITKEMGKPILEARAEVENCAALTCDFYATNAARFLGDEEVETSASRSWISYDPIGVVLAVLPRNFPLWQVVRFAAAALMAATPPS